MKKLYVFGGPNGGGKSTLTTSFYANGQHSNIEMINADEIARTQMTFIDKKEEREFVAAKYAEAKRISYIEDGITFAYETVLSTDRHIKLMQKAKENGYFICTYYVMTEDPKVNVDRVAYRVKNGGHDVDKDKIEKRYWNCVSLLPQVIENSDFFVLFDNTKKYQLIVLKQNEKLYVVDSSSSLNINTIFPNKVFIQVSLEDVGNLLPNNFENLTDMLKEIENGK